MLNQEHLSPEQELVQDLLTMTHVFAARLYGLQNYRKSLKEALHADVSPQDPAPTDDLREVPDGGRRTRSSTANRLPAQPDSCGRSVEPTI